MGSLWCVLWTPGTGGRFTTDTKAGTGEWSPVLFALRNGGRRRIINLSAGFSMTMVYFTNRHLPFLRVPQGLSCYAGSGPRFFLLSEMGGVSLFALCSPNLAGFLFGLGKSHNKPFGGLFNDDGVLHKSTPWAGAVFLPSDTLKAAREATEASGETLPVFVGRAVVFLCCGFLRHNHFSFPGNPGVKRSFP